MADADIGLIGLGTMGSALALNVADNGFRVAVFNRTVSRVHDFKADAGELADRIVPTETLTGFVAAMARPRRIVMMVPAGSVVDDQIAALKPLLDEGDIIVDGGNANFHDTNRRAQAAESEPYAFFGLGVSGGEEGARFGPSMMAGGDGKAWGALEPVLTAIAAKHIDGTPCAAWLGPQGAGHFVKMVHNGIEYADMQMIAEIYGVLRDGYGWDAARIGDAFAHWNTGPLRSYLIEITGEIGAAMDTETGKPVLDVILDKAGQKGTGRWTAIEALHLGVASPVIDAAVAARNLSARIDERAEGAELFGAPQVRMDGEPDIARMEAALISGKIACYAQGFQMLAAASDAFSWTMDLATIARVWRAGCIIRSDMLDDMATAFEVGADNLAFADHFAALLKSNAPSLRALCADAMRDGHATPALTAGAIWFDQMRTKRSTANMLQAQRDFFGRHSFERVDKSGSHHGPWADE
ncbi:MAG: NADP-dependent phosphogluconate dehydrogenase [Pseudomonadota bacterium]